MQMASGTNQKFRKDFIKVVTTVEKMSKQKSGHPGYPRNLATPGGVEELGTFRNRQELAGAWDPGRVQDMGEGGRPSQGLIWKTWCVYPAGWGLSNAVITEQ